MDRFTEVGQRVAIIGWGEYSVGTVERILRDGEAAWVAVELPLGLTTWRQVWAHQCRPLRMATIHVSHPGPREQR
jgi:hypothetical protein